MLYLIEAYSDVSDLFAFTYVGDISVKVMLMPNALKIFLNWIAE